jgi:replicative DNA helicase
MTAEVNKLSDFGNQFQLKLIASLLTNKPFINRIHDIILKDYFESESNQFIIESIKKYYVKFKVQPSLDTLSIIASQYVSDEIVKVSIIDTLLQVKKYLKSDDLPFVQAETLIFCQNKTIKNAILESADLLQYGKYDDIKSLLDKAFKAGFEKKIGLNYTEEITRRYEDAVRNPLKTGWDIIDNLLDGGLGAGDLGIIVASAGIGKSWMLTALGTYALKHNKIILHYTLELSEEYTGRRYDSVLTKVPFRDLKFHKDEVEKKCKNLKGNLIIKEYFLKQASVNTLRAHYEDVITTTGLTPDMMIIDYADRLKSITSDKNTRADKVFGNLYDEIKGLAKELQIPIWSASQTNRQGSRDDVVRGDTISDSFEKLMVADFVMSVSRQDTDKIAGTGRIHIIKNRYGPDGLTYPAAINTDFGYVEIFEAGSVDGQQTSKKMGDDGTGTKNYLSSRFKDFNNLKK